MQHTKIRVFFSYAQPDEKLAHQFLVHLASLKRHEQIEVWHEGEIKAGDVREASISEELEAAHLILLFVTPDFMASTHCYEIEMKRALERHAIGEALVIPIIARPTADWIRAPFGKLRPAPRHRPVTQWGNRDNAWVDVVEQIGEAIYQLTGDTSSISRQTSSVTTSTSGLTFARIAIDGNNAYWHEQYNFGRDEEYAWMEKYDFFTKYVDPFEETGYNQRFHLSAVVTRELETNADPSFDITLLNNTANPVILTDVGIEIVSVRLIIYVAGWPKPIKKIEISASYSIDMPNILRKYEDIFLKDFHSAPLDLNQVISIRVPDPIYVPAKTPFRYQLLLNKYNGHLPTRVILRMWIRTNQGQERSHQILIDKR